MLLARLSAAMGAAVLLTDAAYENWGRSTSSELVQPVLWFLGLFWPLFLLLILVEAMLMIVLYVRLDAFGKSKVFLKSESNRY